MTPNHTPFRRAAVVLLASLLLPASAAWGADQAKDDGEPKPPKLKVGQTVRAEISTGATHTYRIKSKQGAPLRVVVSAVDIAVTSVVAAPDGTRVEPSPATEGQAFDLPSAAEQTWLLQIHTAGGGTSGHYAVRGDVVVGGRLSVVISASMTHASIEAVVVLTEPTTDYRLPTTAPAGVSRRAPSGAARTPL
jgi:hypothetical protein